MTTKKSVQSEVDTAELITSEPANYEPPRRTLLISEEDDKSAVNLFTSLINLIDVVTQRGAVRGDELYATGTLRELLLHKLRELEGVGYTQ